MEKEKDYQDFLNYNLYIILFVSLVLGIIIFSTGWQLGIHQKLDRIEYKIDSIQQEVKQ